MSEELDVGEQDDYAIFWFDVEKATRYLAERFIKHGGQGFEAVQILNHIGHDPKLWNNAVLWTLFRLERMEFAQQTKTNIVDSTKVKATAEAVIATKKLDQPDIVDNFSQAIRKHRVLAWGIIIAIVLSYGVDLATGIKSLCESSPGLGSQDLEVRK